MLWLLLFMLWDVDEMRTTYRALMVIYILLLLYSDQESMTVYSVDLVAEIR